MLKKTSLYLLCSFLLLLLFSCDKEETIKDRENPPQFTIGEDCFRFIGFDIETVTHIRPVEGQNINYAELARPEKLMFPPTVIKCRVETCIDENGLSEGSIEMLTPTIDIQYSEGTVGVGMKPFSPFHRIEFSGSDATYYNEAGEVIRTGLYESSFIEFTSILQQVQNVDSLSEGHMDLVFQAFSDAGLQVETDSETGFVFLTQPLDDGSYSKVILDRQKRTVRGQEDYDVSGNLLSSYFLYMAGDANDLTITGHRYTTLFDSPFSNIKMAINKNSLISNYVSVSN
jgi:hypothetical protein